MVLSRIYPVILLSFCRNFRAKKQTNKLGIPRYQANLDQSSYSGDISGFVLQKLCLRSDRTKSTKVWAVHDSMQWTRDLAASDFHFERKPERCWMYCTSHLISLRTKHKTNQAAFTLSWNSKSNWNNQNRRRWISVSRDSGGAQPVACRSWLCVYVGVGWGGWCWGQGYSWFVHIGHLWSPFPHFSNFFAFALRSFLESCTTNCFTHILPCDKLLNSFCLSHARKTLKIVGRTSYSSKKGLRNQSVTDLDCDARTLFKYLAAYIPSAHVHAVQPACNRTQHVEAKQRQETAGACRSTESSDLLQKTSPDNPGLFCCYFSRLDKQYHQFIRKEKLTCSALLMTWAWLWI